MLGNTIGNNVTVISGEDLNLSLSYFSIKKFKIDKNDFSSYELLSDSFIGTIKNPNDYLGLTGVSNCQLEIYFAPSGVGLIRVSYNHNQYMIEMTFELS